MGRLNLTNREPDPLILASIGDYHSKMSLTGLIDCRIDRWSSTDFVERSENALAGTDFQYCEWLT